MAGKRRNSYQIQALLDRAKERETYKKNKKINTPKAYTKRGDFATAFYHDFAKDRILQVQANDAALVKIGENSAAGAALVGLLLKLPDGKISVPTRGLNYPIVKIHWFYGDDNPAAHTTPWGTRYIKYYDKDGAQSHYSLPFSIAQPPATGVTLDLLIKKFEALFNSQDGTKKSLLGKRGAARLAIGRETILTLNA